MRSAIFVGCSLIALAINEEVVKSGAVGLSIILLTFVIIDGFEVIVRREK